MNSILQVLCVHSKAQFASDRAQEDLSAMGPEEQLREFSSVVLPEETETPLDIVAKMVIVLINLGAEHLVQVGWCNFIRHVECVTEQEIDLSSQMCPPALMHLEEKIERKP